jgi:Macrocin-O-methyltransferase (TylF)/Methyltransferase domain
MTMKKGQMRRSMLKRERFTTSMVISNNSQQRKRGGTEGILIRSTFVMSCLFFLSVFVRHKPEMYLVDYDETIKAITSNWGGKIIMDSFLVSGVVVDHGACVNAIERSVELIINLKGMMSNERKRNIVDMMTKIVLDETLKGDWVETTGSSTSPVESLIAAVVQRTALETRACGTLLKRSVWVSSLSPINSESGETTQQHGTEKMFVDNKFALDGSGPVPIHILNLNQEMTTTTIQATLSDSPVQDIAMLRVGGDSYETILHSLFAFYRRVRLRGYIVVENYGSCTGCTQAIGDFFVDANVEFETIVDDMTAARWFRKNNTNVRVPPEYNAKHLPRHPAVEQAWNTLNTWHRQTTKQFFGHVGNNNFQTYRYVEALRRIILKKKRELDDANQNVRVNVCETGFNGGHSAMLFLAFQEEPAVAVHYYGWDLKEVGSSLPISEKLQTTYGEKFTITWGDSKQTLQDLPTVMKDQRCDLIVVDGEHSKAGVHSDLMYLLPFAQPGAVVFGDDCAPYKRTVRQAPQMKEAWDGYVAQKKLISVANYRNPQLGSPGFVEGVVPSPEDGSFVLGL